jgi:hypothetical protein
MRADGRAGADLLTGEGAVLWWEQPLSVVAGAIVWPGAPEATGLEIGTGSLKLAGLEEVARRGARSTYLEIQSQALGALAQAVTARLGGGVFG